LPCRTWKKYSNYLKIFILIIFILPDLDKTLRIHTDGLNKLKNWKFEIFKKNVLFFPSGLSIFKLNAFSLTQFVLLSSSATFIFLLCATNCPHFLEWKLNKYLFLKKFLQSTLFDTRPTKNLFPTLSHLKTFRIYFHQKRLAKLNSTKDHQDLSSWKILNWKEKLGSCSMFQLFFLKSIFKLPQHPKKKKVWFSTEGKLGIRN